MVSRQELRWLDVTTMGRIICRGANVEQGARVREWLTEPSPEQEWEAEQCPTSRATIS